MRIAGTEDFHLNNTVVSIGKFDCFHKGHQLILSTARNLRTPSSSQVIFTFDKNPSDFLSRENGRYIISSAERRPLVLSFGVDHLVEYPFNEKTRNMTPEEFVFNVLIKKLGVRAVVCGDDFRFGRDRAGGTETLKALGRKYGFVVVVVNRITYKQEVISSTRIRSELAKGNLSDANAMLGRAFYIRGNVAPGRRTGTEMGIPTINLSVPQDKLLPPDGVYITKTLLDGREYPGVTNVGTRPTFFEEGDRFVETNILDFDSLIYGANVRVSFYKFLRPERKFAGAGELGSEIRKNIAEAREYFKDNTQFGKD